MNLLKRLFSKKRNENKKSAEKELLQCLENPEAIPLTKNSATEHMPMHPEGEYVITENGKFLCYYLPCNIIDDKDSFCDLDYHVASKEEMPALIKKSKDELKTAENIINNELGK